MGKSRTIIATALVVWAVVATYFALLNDSNPQQLALEYGDRQGANVQLDQRQLSSLDGLDRLDRLDDQDYLSRSRVVRPESDVIKSWRELSQLPTVNQSNPRAAFEQVVALSSLLPKISNISRIRTPSPEAFRDYIAPVGLPVILTDMFDGQLLSRWDWDYVRSKWGEHVFHNTRQGGYSSKTTKAGKHYVNRVSVKLSDFIDIVTGKRNPGKNEEGLYITKQKVIPEEALEREFYYPPFYPGYHKNCYLEPTGWIGAPGTFTQGHIDSKDNFAYQIIGEKRWTIFSPLDYEYLYYTKGRGSLEWSSVLSTLEKPDLDKYPLYAKATPITFITKPGEVLYLPRGWTHMVENISPSLMINVWRYGPAAITWHWSKENREEIERRCF